MAAIVQALYRFRSSKAETDRDAFTVVALYCSVGLFVSLICVTYGLDLGLDFF
jgi:hypothetical protein